MVGDIETYCQQRKSFGGTLATEIDNVYKFLQKCIMIKELTNHIFV